MQLTERRGLPEYGDDGGAGSSVGVLDTATVFWAPEDDDAVRGDPPNSLEVATWSTACGDGEALRTERLSTGELRYSNPRLWLQSKMKQGQGPSQSQGEEEGSQGESRGPLRSSESLGNSGSGRSPARDLDGLGARFAREGWGNKRGGRGRLIGVGMEGDKALITRN